MLIKVRFELKIGAVTMHAVKDFNFKPLEYMLVCWGPKDNSKFKNLKNNVFLFFRNTFLTI